MPNNDTNYWTRVFARDDLGDLQLAIHKLGADLIYDKAMRESLTALMASQGEVLFSPFIFKREDLSGELADSQLDGQQLMGLGQVATTVKKRFMNEIGSMEIDGASDSNQHVQKLKRGYSRGDRSTVKFDGAFDALEFRENPGRKTKKKHELSSAEIRQIIDAIKINKLAHREAAFKFGINVRLVSSLVVADKKDPEFAKRTLDHEMKRRKKLRAVL